MFDRWQLSGVMRLQYRGSLVYRNCLLMYCMTWSVMALARAVSTRRLYTGVLFFYSLSSSSPSSFLLVRLPISFWPWLPIIFRHVHFNPPRPPPNSPFHKDDKTFRGRNRRGIMQEAGTSPPTHTHTSFPRKPCTVSRSLT